MSDDLTIAYQLGVEDMRSKLHKAADEIERLRAQYEAMDKMLREANQHFMRVDMERNKLRAENETLRRDVKTAVMGDSAELQDVKRKNEKLRRAMHDIYEIYAGSDGTLIETSPDYLKHMIIEMANIAAEHKRAAAAAIRESGE